MRARLLITAAAVVSAVAIATPAAAGGVTQIEWESRYRAVGQRAVGRAEVFFGSAADARREIAGGRYFVYLQPGDPAYRIPPSEWRGLRGPAVRAGEVRLRALRGFGRSVVQAQVAFRVPDLPTGVYGAVLCDAGCRRVLGDVWPTPLEIVGSAAEARLRPLLEQDEVARQEQQRRFATRLRARIRDVEVGSVNVDSSLRSDVDELKDRSDDLRARLGRLTAAQEATATAARLTSAGLAALVLLIVALLAAALLRRALRARPGPPQARAGRDPEDIVDDERAQEWERV